MNRDTRKLRVLFAASEAEPFYKVGGLGDYAGSLPRAINNYFISQDHAIDMRVVIPLHNPDTIDAFQLKRFGDLVLSNTSLKNKCNVFYGDFDKIPHYFIQQEIPQPESNSVYGFDQHKTAQKYAIFSLSILEMIEKYNWRPDIIHTNDWHTALVNHQVRSHFKKFDDIKTLLTIHNMPFMGYGSEPVYKDFHISSVHEDTFPSWAQNLPLPMGISTADEIVAVSPSYAEELKTNYFAYGLEEYFITHQEKLTGIINGIDYSKWDPENDPDLYENYSIEKIHKRKNNKKSLYEELGFNYNEKEPLIIVISRLENQKGIDLILDAFSEISNKEWKAIILGSGHHGYEHAFRALERVFPHKIKSFLEYNPELARKLYASGDIILMPSLYEPCGLSQMIAMRYGCIPVAHAVGGLKDSILTSPENKRTGFLFNTPTKYSFIDCIIDAMQYFANDLKWKNIQSNAMKADFSWKKSAEYYANLYTRLIQGD